MLDGEVATPETVEEFERLVLSSPDSSLCWIQYMAFHMQVSKTVHYNAFIRLFSRFVRVYCLQHLPFLTLVISDL